MFCTLKQIEVQDDLWRDELKIIVDGPLTRDHTVIILIIPKRLKSRPYDLDKSTVYACTPRWAHK